MVIDNLPEVFLSTGDVAYKVSRLLKDGQVKKLTGNLYTSNVTDDVDKIVSTRLWEIVGLLFPGAIISDRTAFYMGPNKDHEIFIVSEKSRRPVKVGSYTIYPRPGAAVQSSDTPFMGNLFLASNARKYLENMRVSRNKVSIEPRYLSQQEIEEKLDQYIRVNGEAALNKLRDDMRTLSATLKLESEFNKINSIISTLLRTHTSRLKSNVGIARSMGEEFDPERVVLFTALYEALSSTAPVIRKTEQNFSPVLCFYESYFSNYIEGTKFAVSEAQDIVFNNKIPASRPDDAHDIAGTYAVISSEHDMLRTPKNFDDFIDILKKRHARIMEGRPEKEPGKFKTLLNQAGSTVFVEPNLVVGTLKQAFELYSRLDTAFARAVFMMCAIAEVHPFNDGNGRISRIMMNSELVANNESRIIIPTIYRSNYLMALKGFSHNKITDSIIKTMDFAQKYTSQIDWTDLRTATDILQSTNAFVEDAENTTALLRLPK